MRARLATRYGAAIIALIAVIVLILLSACSGTSSAGTGAVAQGAGQSQSQEIWDKTNKDASNYYVSTLNGMTAEVKNVLARNLRLKDPNRIQYVAVVSQNGQLIFSGAARGKISSTQSQITQPNNVFWKYTGSSGIASAVTESVGDDGTYGAEECPGDGIFFFDMVTDAMHTICTGNATVLESDAPFTFTTRPILVNDSAVASAIPKNGSTKNQVIPTPAVKSP